MISQNLLYAILIESLSLQEEDRAFDKGEMNTHSEEVILARTIGNVLSQIPADGTVCRHLVVSHLLTVQSTDGAPDMTYSDFLLLLGADILLVTDLLLSSIEGKMCMQVHGCSKLLVQIARRASVWSALLHCCDGQHALTDMHMLVAAAGTHLQAIQFHSVILNQVVEDLKCSF